MPTVKTTKGTKKFPYTKKGESAAKKYANKANGLISKKASKVNKKK